MVSWSGIIGVAIAIVIPNAVGFIGASFTRKEVTSKWYKTLRKSPLNPPNWVFPVAWTSLYTLMGIASYLVYSSGQHSGQDWNKSTSLPLILYFAQLAVNGTWNPVFFRARRPDLALVDVIVLDALVFTTIFMFYEVSHLAAILLVPYALWTSFATYLNAYIVCYN